MKKILAATAFLVLMGIAVTAQTPPPPPDNPSNGGNGPVGGGAPVGEGIAMLAMLGAAYGAKKVFKIRKNE